MAYPHANNIVTLYALNGYERGLYRPKHPIGYLLKNKVTEGKRKFYFNKPIYDPGLFDLIPVYQVEAD